MMPDWMLKIWDLRKRQNVSLKIQLGPPFVLSSSFFLLILLGTILLKLPFSTNIEITWLQSLFTATSAITVTGLVVLDTGTNFTVFGQLIIALLIQVGGLGLMTFAVVTLNAIGMKMGFFHQAIAKEAFNQTDTSTLVSTAKAVLLLALAIEAIAFFILTIYWYGSLGLGQSMFYAFFYTISAFNNAGFALHSDSLMSYVSDPVINLTISMLIISGGLGFSVWIDLWQKKSWHKLTLYSRMMLTGTFFLILVSVLVIYWLERDNPGTLGSLDGAGKWWGAWFQAVTPRTAGFNSIDIASMKDATSTLMLSLMFIGGGSLSTASGIKVVTLMVLICATYSFIRRENDVNIFKRKIPDYVVRKAFALTIISMGTIWIGTFVLLSTENAAFLDVLFEVVSALGTVGLSRGLTGNLSSTGQIIICLIMFIGRMGPLLLAYLLASPRQQLIRYPQNKLPIG